MLLLYHFAFPVILSLTPPVLRPKLDVSRVSKRNLFALFQALCAKMRRESLQKFTMYSEAKEAAVTYQCAKRSFFWALQEMGYGSWICKPQEEKTFGLADV